jgi:hypothetical protein
MLTDCDAWENQQEDKIWLNAGHTILEGGAGFSMRELVLKPAG